jgi:hypothetical protein
MDNPPPAMTVTDSAISGNANVDRLAALEAFDRLSRAFSSGFDDSKSQAYSHLLKDLMDNSALLVSGGLMTANEILGKIEDLQEHMHKDGGTGRATLDEFHDFFGAPMDTTEPAP